MESPTDKVVPFRERTGIPIGCPYIAAWFDENGDMHWCQEGTDRGQMAYFAARLLHDSVSEF